VSINQLYTIGHSPATCAVSGVEATMELIFTTVAVIGGMTFSLAIAILVEELIFGKVLGAFFAPRAPQPKAAVQR
jgi:hypothetical protein